MVINDKGVPFFNDKGKGKKGKMPKIGPKINKIEIWPKSGLKVIIS